MAEAESTLTHLCAEKENSPHLHSTVDLQAGLVNASDPSRGPVLAYSYRAANSTDEEGRVHSTELLSELASKQNTSACNRSIMSLDPCESLGCNVTTRNVSRLQRPSQVE